jgi:hypothetical protein
MTKVVTKRREEMKRRFIEEVNQEKEEERAREHPRQKWRADS